MHLISTLHDFYGWAAALLTLLALLAIRGDGACIIDNENLCEGYRLTH